MLRRPLLIVPALLILLCGCVNPAVQQQKIKEAEAAQRRQIAARVAARDKEQQDRRDAYIGAHPELREEIKSAIHAGKFAIGMTEEDALVCMSEAAAAIRHVNRTTTAYGTSNFWSLYDGRYLSFNNGILESIQSSGRVY